MFETAQEMFGISPLMTAENLVNDEPDQLAMLAYLTQLKDAIKTIPDMTGLSKRISCWIK